MSEISKEEAENQLLDKVLYARRLFTSVLANLL